MVIQVFPARTHQTISFQGHGKYGTLLLGKTKARLMNLPLATTTDEKAYWESVVTQVLNAIQYT